MRPPRLSGHRWSCLLGPGRDCFGGALLVSKKTINITLPTEHATERQNRWGTAQSRGCSVPAELEEGSWLVEGRLLLSDAWLDSSISPWDTTGSTDTSAPGLNQAKCTSDYVNCDLHNLSHFGQVIETEWNERFQETFATRIRKEAEVRGVTSCWEGRGSPISVWLQEDVVSLLPCTGSSWCWCAHHGNRLRGVLCCVGLSHFWENSYWKIERGKQISTFQKLVVLPKPKFHHSYPRTDSFEEAREKAVRNALTNTSLHIRLTETDKYLVPQLVAEWWERCVHQTPPREWLKTGDCHTSQDLKRRISLQLKRLWCILMVVWG